MSRIRDAFAVLRGYRLDYEDADPIPAGPIRHAHCAELPDDTIAVRAIHATKQGDVVGFHMVSTNGPAYVILRPNMARAFAAAVLDCADEADGTTPLVFVPQGPAKEGAA